MNRKVISLLFSLVLPSAACAAPVDVIPLRGSLAHAVQSTLPDYQYAVQPQVFVRADAARFAFANVPADTSPNSVLEDASPIVASATELMSWVYGVSASVAPRIIDESCLAQAVYFEARSESEEGQIAVATVILNRVKSPHYPKSICGVVFQGAQRRTGCQFSFTCDGRPDLPAESQSWAKAFGVAEQVLAEPVDVEDENLLLLATATHYHADYVKPRWSRSLTRLTKIGRHIFYSQS